jgi:hypothetical protein
MEEASRIVIEKQTFFLPTEVCCCSSFPVLLPSSSPDSGWVGGLSRLLTGVKMGGVANLFGG